MICKCGHEEFNVLKVFRNRRIKNGTFKFSDRIDSRIIICKLCGRRFITETFIAGELYNRNFKLIVHSDQGEFEFQEEQ